MSIQGTKEQVCVCAVCMCVGVGWVGVGELLKSHCRVMSTSNNLEKFSP